MAEGVIAILDSGGISRNVKVDIDGTTYTHKHIVRVGTLDVSAANPMPSRLVNGSSVYVTTSALAGAKEVLDVALRELRTPAGVSMVNESSGSVRVALGEKLDPLQDGIYVGQALPFGDFIIGRTRIENQLGIISSANTRTTPVTVATPFVGTAEGSVGYNTIAVVGVFDQPGTLFIEKSNNTGTNWDISVPYTTLANVGFEFKEDIIGSESFRVRWINGGAATTTINRLFTFKKPISSITPNRLTPAGNFPVAIMEGSTSGTQYTVNAVVPGDPVGTALVLERDDVLSPLTEVEGRWTNARGNGNGALWVVADGIVSLISGQVGISAGAGVVAANTPRMVLASDQPPVNTVEVPAAILYNSVVVGSAGDNLVHNPAAGKKVRVHFLNVGADDDNAVSVIYTAKFGAGGGSKHSDMLQPGAKWSHHHAAGRHYIEGAVDEDFIINLSVAENCRVNYGYEEI